VALDDDRTNRSPEDPQPTEEMTAPFDALTGGSGELSRTAGEDPPAGAGPGAPGGEERADTPADDSEPDDRPAAPADAAWGGEDVQETDGAGGPGDPPDDQPTVVQRPVEAEAEAEAEPREPDPERAPYETVESEALAVPPASTPTRASGAVDPQLDALRDATFPVVWRGYDVQAVDDYVTAVEAALERFEERTTPTVAVQRALDRVGEQTAAILRQAEQAADETTRASRARADDRLQRAEREAAELHDAAVARVRALDDDVERLWQERQRLIDATKDLAAQLRTVADDAESRFPPAAAELPAADADAPPPEGAAPPDERGGPPAP
jgi:DivIVA domain-containing protein